MTYFRGKKYDYCREKKCDFHKKNAIFTEKNAISTEKNAISVEKNGICNRGKMQFIAWAKMEFAQKKCVISTRKKNGKSPQKKIRFPLKKMRFL